MNAIKLTGIVAAGALLASSAAFAGPKWTFVEGAYVQGETIDDGTFDDNDRYTLGGSYGFADMYHVQGYYIDGEVGTFDYDGFELNFGVNPSITDNTDFVANVFYQVVEFDDAASVIGDEFEPTSYGTRIGLRSMLTDQVEVSAYGVYTDTDGDTVFEDTQGVSAQLGGQYYWTEQFSIGMEVDLGASGASNLLGGDEMKFSARWNF